MIQTRNHVSKILDGNVVSSSVQEDLRQEIKGLSSAPGLALFWLVIIQRLKFTLIVKKGMNLLVFDR